MLFLRIYSSPYHYLEYKLTRNQNPSTNHVLKTTVSVLSGALLTTSFYGIFPKMFPQFISKKHGHLKSFLFGALLGGTLCIRFTSQKIPHCPVKILQVNSWEDKTLQDTFEHAGKDILCIFNLCDELTFLNTVYIDKLKTKGVTIFGMDFGHSNAENMENTKNKLEKLKISFDRYFINISQKNEVIKLKQQTSIDQKECFPKIYSGIIFTDKAQKGKVIGNLIGNLKKNQKKLFLLMIGIIAKKMPVILFHGM